MHMWSNLISTFDCYTFHYRAWRPPTGTEGFVCEKGWPSGGNSASRGAATKCSDTRAEMVAAWSEGRLVRALALVSMRMRLEASLLLLPATSIPRATKQRILLHNHSG